MNTRHTKDPALDPAAHASTARENPVQTPTATDTAKEQKKKTRSARTTQGHQQVLSQELVDFARKTEDRISRKFGSFVAAHKMRNVDVYHTFSPLISDPSKVTLMMQGVQKVPLPVLVALHYHFVSTTTSALISMNLLPETVTSLICRQTWNRKF